MENAIKAVQRKSRPYLFHFQLDKALGSQENHAGFDKFATVFGRPTSLRVGVEKFTCTVMRNPVPSPSLQPGVIETTREVFT